MAQLLDITTPLQFGYFYSSSFEEIVLYLDNLLEANPDGSFIFTVHSSALFERGPDQLDIHRRPLEPIILDGDMPHLYDLMDTVFDRLTDPESYQYVEESGFVIVPGTTRFWFKIYPCQPNPDTRPTQNNTSDFGGDSDNSEDMEISPRQNECNNTLLLSLAEHHFRADPRYQRLPRTIIAKKVVLTEYMKNEQPHLYERQWVNKKDFNLKDLANWHVTHRQYSLRVFSLRGNVLYAKTYPDATFVDLYITSKRKIGLVLMLNALFRRGLDRQICDACHTFHRNPNNCALRIVEAQTTTVKIPELPTGRHCLVIYADFESILAKNDDPNFPSTKHLTSGYSLVCLEYGLIIGEGIENALTCDNLIETFIKSVFSFSKNYAFNCDIEESADCKICGEIIGHRINAVHGRNFINGLIGSNHHKCWNDHRNCAYIFFHNFRGYDSHFLMSDLVQNTEIVNMQATTMERFNLIRCRENNVQICFKDTFNFFSCSLANACSNVEHFRYADELNNPDNRGKGVFPYDWFDNFDKLNETELPPAPWLNTLTGQLLDHEKAMEVWRERNMRTFAEYHDYYMHLDVLILADIFEQFRDVTLAEFKIDPVQFQGAPGLTWYLGLKSKPDLFKVIRDKDVYLDIQANIRGGVSQAMSRYQQPADDESIIYLDVNSLYSYCMTMPMPNTYLGKFDTLPPHWEAVYGTKESQRCAFMVVDLVYPEHIHDRDYEYPLAPHKFNDRLCTTFLRKEKYMVHGVLLKYYLDRGMVLEKFHYMYVFLQDFALKDYVSNNIEKRRNTNSAPMKTLYKLLNNSLYGKTCENVFKYRVYEVHEEEELDGGQINPFLYRSKNHIQFGEKFLCEMQRDSVHLDKPIQIGFTILEFAKLHMYEFIYKLRDTFENKVEMLYTDTDSLMIWVDHPDGYRMLYDNEEIRPLLDYSTFDYGDKATEKQSGLWSPENDGKRIIEYVGLRSKTYAIRFEDNEEVLKNKGVMKTAQVLDNNRRVKISIEHYKKAVFEGTDYRVVQNIIRSDKHKVFSREEYKIGLSSNDMKRTVLHSRKDTLPFGYKGIQFSDLAVDAQDPDHYTT